MEIKTHTLGQRCMAYILLASFLLQSCYNPGIPSDPLPPKKKEELSFSIIRSEQEQLEKKESLAQTNEFVFSEIATTSLKKGLVVSQVEFKQGSTQIVGETSRGQDKSGGVPKIRPALLEGAQYLIASSKEQASHLTFLQGVKGREGKRLSESSPVNQVFIPVAFKQREGNKQVSDKPYLAQGGHEVRLKQLPSGKWQALVKESLPAGIKREMVLPIYFLPGYSLVDVSKYEDNLACYQILCSF